MSTLSELVDEFLETEFGHSPTLASNLGLIPTAGVPFPLLSYGGTAATVHIATLGLVLALRADGETHRL